MTPTPKLPDEFWQIMCLKCYRIGYYRVRNPVTDDLLPYRKWPILRCVCGHHFTKEEVEFCKFGVCEKIEPRPLVKRHAEDVELEVRKK